jgi:hypothetical protein
MRPYEQRSGLVPFLYLEAIRRPQTHRGVKSTSEQPLPQGLTRGARTLAGLDGGREVL